MRPCRFTRAAVLLMVLSGAIAPRAHPASAARRALPPPVTFTTEEDHRNMMEQLGIEALRPGASGDENAPDHANYDELLANPYPTLPDPLTLNDGKKVTTASLWWSRRRPEIVAALEKDVYGRIPNGVPKVTWRVEVRGTGKLGGYPIVYRRLVGHVDNSAYPAVSVDIPVTLVLPAAARKRVPVLIMLWFGPIPVPPTEPSDTELDELNGALRSALVSVDPSLRAVFRSHPDVALLSRSPFSP